MTPFDPGDPLVLVRGEVTGPTGAAALRLVVDTGASHSAIRRDSLEDLGCNLAAPDGYLRFLSATGEETVPIVRLTSMTVLDIRLGSFPVASVQFPPEAPFDGLLGLDFFRGRRLTLDFRTGQLELD